MPRATGNASATVVAPLDLDALTDQAERIAVARVESRSARWTADRDAIYTDVNLRVMTAVKGEMKEGEVITVRRLGGVVDGIGMKVAGEALFEEGEEVLVFLERRGVAATAGAAATAPFWTVGMAQGKMRVVVADGRKVVTRDRSSLAGLGYTRTPAPEPSSLTLDEVLTAIRARKGRGQGVK